MTNNASNSTSRASREAHLDRIFCALADPTRRSILSALANGPATVTRLAEPFSISLPAVSKHIKVLQHAGLLTRRIDGRVHRCAIDAAPLRAAADFIERYRRFWEGQFDALEQYLETTRAEGAPAEAGARSARRPGRTSHDRGRRVRKRR